MTPNLTPSRRDFMRSLAAAPAAGLAAGAARRGLALAGEDFAFAPGLVYLQTGSLGPTPRPVLERAVAAWSQLQTNPSFRGYGDLEQGMEAARAKAAAFLGCRTEELVVTTSTTAGMNWTAQGLALAAGDRVLTTDQEHPGGRACWDYVARRSGAVLDVVVIPPDEHDAGAIVDRFAKAVTPRTRVFSFSHVLSSTGLRMPVAGLSALARSHGCVAVVDGAQAIGAAPVDVKALGCHVYAASGHKWLLGPPGTGVLFLSSDLGTGVDPIALQGGRASYSDSSGVSSLPSVIGMGAAIDYVSAIGLARIDAHNLALRNRLYAALHDVPRLRVVSAPPGPLASALLSYRLPDDVDSHAFQQRMRERRNIELKVVPRNWFNGNRVSTHLFNSEQDVDALVAALGAELSA
jgi:selenocysteine lyase/cysteine desulfurase